MESDFGGQNYDWIYFKMNTPQLAARGCAAAVSLMQGKIDVPVFNPYAIVFTLEPTSQHTWRGEAFLLWGSKLSRRIQRIYSNYSTLCSSSFLGNIYIRYILI
jgi:hypothetical protein